MTQSIIITESVFAPSAFKANAGAGLALSSGAAVASSKGGQDILLIIVLFVVALALLGLIAYAIHESQNPAVEETQK